MLMVNALAGTGKTTTGLWGLGIKVPKGIKVSEEQKKIVTHMRGYEWGTAAACAFNASIAKELERRVPPGVEAATINAFGYRAWLAFIGKSKIKVNNYKNYAMFDDFVGKGMAWKDKQKWGPEVDKIVGLYKCYMMEPTRKNFNWLCDRFDLDISDELYDYSKAVYEKGLEEKEYFDFNDQLFMPLHYNISIPKFDLVLVDELQDLNVAKQEFAFRMGEIIIGIGDKHQSIYGFSGADSDSMDNVFKRMKKLDKKATQLSLTITRRCPKVVVRRANRWVPELRAHKDAPEGELITIKEGQFAESLIKGAEGTMTLCRTNAPLASLAFKLLARKRRCFIRGKDIGAGLKRAVRATDESNLDIAVGKAVEKIYLKIQELRKKKFKDDAKVEALRDRATCMVLLKENADTVETFCEAVDAMFKDQGSDGDIELSSVHKAKGMEHKRVAIIKPSTLPFTRMMKVNKNGKESFQCQQEKNLAYVADTRSMHTLVIATEEEPKDDPMDFDPDNYEEDYGDRDE